jgi:hypothetical protein
MAEKSSLCLQVAVANLSNQSDRFVIWVLRSPHPGGHTLHDCRWSPAVTAAWQKWQSIFAIGGLTYIPNIPSSPSDLEPLTEDIATADDPVTGQPANFSGQYMQQLGVSLWQWLFAGPIKSSYDSSEGIAIGQVLPLRLRLDIRAPELIGLPWEIMQPQVGKKALSLNRNILFSRTSSDVDRLETTRPSRSLRILLVIGKPIINKDEGPSESTEEEANDMMRKLADEAVSLKKKLEQNSDSGMRPTAKRTVDVLLQPSAVELTQKIDRGDYNVFFYAGHGKTGPDGGLLFVSQETTLSGTELAQVLTRAKVQLAVFNSCWGAHPERTKQALLPRSSLAEVLLHHGLPAAVAMREPIGDEEAIYFIQTFAQKLAERTPVDEAVVIARQQLLTRYHFNQPAWTLPVLYMHPDYDGELLLREETTQISPHSDFLPQRPKAFLRDSLGPDKMWHIYSDVMRIGRKPDANDVVLHEGFVSGSHAEIFQRRANNATKEGLKTVYFLKDFSTYGTFYYQDGNWQLVHRQEIALQSGTQLRFGSKSEGRLLEFVVES